MKKGPYLLLLFILPAICNAQTFQWAGSFEINSIGHNYISSMELDAQGNIYAVGVFSRPTDFDMGPGTTILTPIYHPVTAHAHDIFITKTDPLGNLIWVKSISNNKMDNITGLVLDSTANIYITGDYTDSADLDPGPGVFKLHSNAPYAGQRFVSKLDSAGNFIWAVNIGIEPSPDINFDDHGIILDHSQSNVFVAGDSLVKISSSGSIIWTKPTGITGNVSIGIRAFKMGVNGNIHITGQFVGVQDFDPGPAVYNLVTQGLDLFISTFDTNGNFVWAKSTAGSNSTAPLEMIIDRQGNIYITGNFSGTVDIDPNTGVHNLVTNNQGVFLLKLDSVGGFVWAFPIQVSGSGFLTVTGRTLTLDTSDNVILGGDYRVGSDFDPDVGTFYLPGTQGKNNFVAKYTSNGNLISAKELGSLYLTDIETDHNNDMVLAGYFLYSCEMDPDTSSHFVYTPPPNGGPNGVMSKWSNCSLVAPVAIVTTCDSFSFAGNTYYSSGNYFIPYTTSGGCDSSFNLNLAIYQSTTNTVSVSGCGSLVMNGQTYTSSGIYTQVLQNSQGCDSTLTLNLTINSSPTASVTSTGLILSATPGGATYQWIKCNPYSTILGATNQTYTVTSNGDYAVVGTQNGCSDTSNCISFTNVAVDDILLEGISVYPNPTSKQLTITSENEMKNAKLQLVNALGQIVYRQEGLLGKQFQVDMTSFTNGLYTIEFTEGAKVSRSKVLKR